MDKEPVIQVSEQAKRLKQRLFAVNFTQLSEHKKQFDDAFAKAQQAENDNQPDKAATSYLNAGELLPRSPFTDLEVALIKLVLASIEQQQLEQAAQPLQQDLISKLDKFRVHFHNTNRRQQAQLIANDKDELKQKKYDQALFAKHGISDKETTSEPIWQQLANQFLADKDIEQIKERFYSIVQNHPTPEVKGELAAKLNLYSVYNEVHDRPEQTIKGYLHAATLGDGQSLDRLFQQTKPDNPKAIEFNKEGPAEQLVYRGIQYLSGIGVEPNVKNAFKLFLKAAEQEHPDGHYFLAMMYYQGLVVDTDKKQAFQLFQRASAKNHVLANLMLGQIYEETYDNSRSKNKAHLDRAIQYYEKASDSGNSEAQYRLASMYQNHTPTKQRSLQALVLMNTAAEAGHKHAQFYLKQQKYEVSFNHNYFQLRKQLTKNGSVLLRDLFKRSPERFMALIKYDRKFKETDRQQFLETCYQKYVNTFFNKKVLKRYDKVRDDLSFLTALHLYEENPVKNRYQVIKRLKNVKDRNSDYYQLAKLLLAKCSVDKGRKLNANDLPREGLIKEADLQVIRDKSLKNWIRNFSSASKDLSNLSETPGKGSDSESSDKTSEEVKPPTPR